VRGQKALDTIMDHMQSQDSRAYLGVQFDPLQSQWTVNYSYNQVDDPDTPTMTVASVKSDLADALGQVASELT
jgi:hypothetical protein